MKASHNRRFAAAAIALGATVTVTLQDGIKECCTSAHAQTKTASPNPTIWDHNGSVMYLVENGSSREFHYQSPRPGMIEAGARPGSLLFRGQVDNGQYFGTAYIFNPHCGQIPFQVKGPVLDDDERITLTGEAPQVGRNCRTHRYYASSLEFKRLSPEGAQLHEPIGVARAPNIEDTKPELTPQVGGELPGSPAALPSVTSNSPSAAKDSSRNVAERREPGTSITEPSVTNRISPAAQDPDNYRSGIAFIVMIVSLFSFSLAVSLSKNSFGRKRWMR
jgi:hypothetical protein